MTKTITPQKKRNAAALARLDEIVRYCNDLVLVKAIENLTEARKLVEQGWTQGTYFNSKYEDDRVIDCFCAVGAVRRVAENKSDFTETRNVATAALSAAVFTTHPFYGYSIEGVVYKFNDDVAKESREVERKFGKAIQLLNTLLARRAAANTAAVRTKGTLRLKH